MLERRVTGTRAHVGHCRSSTATPFPVPYDYTALEPHIDAQTMEIHHDKHHEAYVTNLNAALEKHPELQEKSIEDLIKGLDTVPEDIRTAVRNNGGGHANHTLFWKIMGPARAARPTGKLGEAINATFGGFDTFKEQFAQGRRRRRFGSGWAWLIDARRQARRREHREPGQPADGRQDAGARPRRVGARVLPEVPEPPARLHHGVVERRELGRGQQASALRLSSWFQNRS